VCLNGLYSFQGDSDSAELYEMVKEGDRRDQGAWLVAMIMPSHQTLREVAERLAGVEFLLRKNRIPLLAGAGRLEGKNRVIIETSGQGAQQV